MAVLQVIQGSTPGQLLELSGERTLIGRHPQCQIVLDNVAVSRHHAQILENHGNYYLEDLRSRNGTQLNKQPVQGKAELRESDVIGICDFEFRFLTTSLSQAGFQSAPTMPNQPAVPSSPPADPLRDFEAQAESAVVDSEPEEEQFSDRSSIISTLKSLEPGAPPRLDINPEAKLRAVLQISNALHRSLKVDEVLPKLLESLFRIFMQADTGFVLLKDLEQRKLVVKASMTRNPDDDSVGVSTTIVRQALHSGESILSADAVQDTRFDHSESLSNFRIRSMMCSPLIGKNGDSLGVIQISTNDVGKQFGEADLELLVSVSAQASLAIENATLHEAVLAQRDLERDLEFATQVQLGFLPNKRPEIPGYSFFDYYEAAQSVGGDYFDYIDLPGGRIALTLGDVAGKGVSAALLMARLYSSARYQLLTQPTASVALDGLNRELSSCGLGYRFITFLVMVLDPYKHELVIANAGHMPPLLRNRKNKVKQIGRESTGLPLGITGSHEYGQTKISIEQGDSITVYTDGVTEAMNSDRDIYRTDRLTKFIEQGPINVEQLIRGIVADVESFSDSSAQRDDICLVAFSRDDPGKTEPPVVKGA